MTQRRLDAATPAPTVTRWTIALLVAVVIVVSLNLRAGLTSLGPVSSLIQSDLHVSRTFAGLMASIPVFCFGVGALVSPHVVTRWGMDSVILCALGITGVSTIVRSYTPSVGLWFGTVALGLAIGVLNGALPAVIKRDFGSSAQKVMGLYSANLTFGAGFSAALAVPLAEWVSWRFATAVWAVLAALGIVAWLATRSARARLSAHNAAQHSAAQEHTAQHNPVQANAAQHSAVRGTAAPHNTAPHTTAPHRAQQRNATSNPAATPNLWRNPVAWAATLYMGIQSMLFYTWVQWLPELQHSRGVSTAAAGRNMFLFQIAGIIGTLTLVWIQGNRLDQRRAAITASVLWAVGLSGVLWLPSAMVPSIVIMGAGGGITFSLALAMISTRTDTPTNAAALSGMIQSLGYMLAAIGPALAGAIAGELGWNAVLVIALVCSGALLALGTYAGRPVVIDKDGTHRASTSASRR